MAINVVTIETLPKQFALWQRFFRLKDWEIEGKIVDEGYFDDAAQIGGCEFWIEERRAVIALINAEVGDRITQEHAHQPFYDMEKTLLHEMLHIFFAPLEADADSIFLEQKVNLMTERLTTCRWWIESGFKAEDLKAQPAVGLALAPELTEAVAA
ncbi:MAG: hypothetical protein ACR2FS_03965 [Phormidesmis sp.]